MTIRHKRKVMSVVLLALLTAGYLSWSYETSEATVAFLDVGQGDSIFVSLPGGVQILIDGGPDRSVVQKISSYMPFSDRTIELVILTHPHADHVRGLTEILTVYNVERVMLTGVRHDSNTYQRFLEAVVEEGSTVYLVRQGDYVRIGGMPLLEVLAPQDDVAGTNVPDANQSSIVARLSLGGLSFLLTGDADGEAERMLLQERLVDDIDGLKGVHPRFPQRRP